MIMDTDLQQVSRARCFGGWQHTFSFLSQACAGSRMRFALYLPPQAEHGPVPALWWLSGLTCTEENFTVKAGAQRVAAELGLALVMPDTSPRALDTPGQAESWDVGLGAGFYLDATRPPFAGGWNMETHVARELPALVTKHFPIDAARMAVSGHSMGGHGALALAMKHPSVWKSVSAFAPIASATRCPWGRKALSRYLGEDEAGWRAHDVSLLMADRGWSGPEILVDQGEADPFMDEQLQPHLLEAAAATHGVPLRLRRHAGYDHGYFFVASFIEEHLRLHARRLQDA